MDVLLWQAMCGHNTNGSVGLHKHTHKLKQQFSLADQREVKTLLGFTFAAFFCFLHCHRFTHLIKVLRPVAKLQEFTFSIIGSEEGPKYSFKMQKEK